MRRYSNLKLAWMVSLFTQNSLVYATELNQRFGVYDSSEGESRSMTRMDGRVESRAFAGGSLKTSLSLNASMEQVKVDDPQNSKYMNAHFSDGRRVDRSFGLDNGWVYEKRTEVNVGGSMSGDTVTHGNSKRASIGQWFLGDQLRVGVQGATSETRRPEDSFLDYDSETIKLREKVTTESRGVSIKGILNPTTVVNGEYNQVQSSERPVLHAWSAGVRQFIPVVEGAVHGDVSRVINLGELDTSMANGELTGWQYTLAYLQSFSRKTNGRFAYRFMREDEYTRAYQDHLVFGADSYSASVTQELPKGLIDSMSYPLQLDFGVTRYIHNQGGAATTLEGGMGVQF